jgi:hypothetical protein
MAGSFIELCDCFTVCPCWVNLPPTEGRCTGVFGWSVETGEIDGVDVGGRSVVSLSFHNGHRNTGDQSVWVYVDERADDPQLNALKAAFTGELGGPLEELGSLLGRLEAVERAAIAMESVGNSLTLTVGRRIEADGTVLRGADGETTELAHARLSKILGTPAEVGTAARLRIDLATQGFDIDVSGRAAMRGRFDYRHAAGG